MIAGLKIPAVNIRQNQLTRRPVYGNPGGELMREHGTKEKPDGGR